MWQLASRHRSSRLLPVASASEADAMGLTEPQEIAGIDNGVALLTPWAVAPAALPVDVRFAWSRIERDPPPRRPGDHGFHLRSEFLLRGSIDISEASITSNRITGRGLYPAIRGELPRGARRPSPRGTRNPALLPLTLFSAGCMLSSALASRHGVAPTRRLARRRGARVTVLLTTVSRARPGRRADMSGPPARPRRSSNDAVSASVG